MLGKLARWLRLLGFDTLYFRSISDAALTKAAHRQRRLLLTCDKELIRHHGDVALIPVPSHHPPEQLHYLISLLHLDTDTYLFSRCVHCNEPVHEVETSELALDGIPPHVLATHRTFYRCPTCGRYYWPGSHHEKIRRALARFNAKQYDSAGHRHH